MYTLTISKTLKAKYGFYKHLILKGFYVRIGKIVIALWENNYNLLTKGL